MLWREIVYELIASIDQNRYKEQDGLGQVASLLDCFTNLFERHSQYVVFSYDYKLFLIRHNAYLSESEYIDEIRPIQNMYLKALEKGMRDGSIAVHPDPMKVYYAIWGLIRGYIVKIVIYDRMYGGANMWRESYRFACRLVINGLREGNVFLEEDAAL